MSRSRKKTPAITWCGNTNKKSKRTCNRIFRKLAKARIRQSQDPPLKLSEVMDTWDFNTDGLAHYRRELDPRYMRK